MWSRRLAPALAACALSVDAAGQQDFDVRPIYYAMLAAVESSFTAHSEKIEETYRTSREALERSATRDLRHLETEGEEIERARRDRAAVFEAERAALNARIEAVNEAVGRIETDREGSAAAIESYREAYVRVLDELQAARSRHRALIAVVQARREALENLAHAYREGTSEDAQEVARLDNAYRRFVAQVLDAFGGREAALRLERESLRTWLHDQLARLERSEGELVPLTERLAALEDDHDRVQGELNRRIDVYNEHVRAARENDTQGDELTALRVGIAEYRELLDEHRTRAATLVREYRNRHAALRAEHEAFEGERMERREALRLRTETLVSERRDIADLVESRRTDVQAQIELIEDRVRASLSALRAEAESAQSRFREEFGSAPSGLLAAATQWTQTLDPSHLYESNGAALFERSQLRSAALYDAVDAVRALEGETRGALGQHLAQVQRERAEIAGERQDLVERQSAFADEYAELQSRWEARLDAGTKESRRLADALTGYFEGHFALVGLELELLQGSLLNLLGTPAMARSGPGERERLQVSVSEHGATLGTVIEMPPAPAYPLVEGFAAAGRARVPEATDSQWQHLNGESFPREHAPETSILEGDTERRILAAWYGRLRATGSLDPLAQGLSRHLPSHSRADREDALYGLFEAGMSDAGDTLRLRWKDGKTAYQIQMLDRSYWLQPNGRLLLTPLAW